MAETRNPREVVDIGKFKPYTHPQYGEGAVREVEYIDGTIERRFFFHNTEKEGEGTPDSGYLVDTKVNPERRAEWERNKPTGTAAGPKEGDVRGAPGSKRREVYRGGQWVVEDNPTYEPPASQTQPQTVSTNTTEPYIVTRQPDGSIKTDKNPNYKGADPKPASQVTVKGGDGKTYIVTVDSTGNVTTKDSGVPAEVKEPKERPRIQDPETKEWLEKGEDGTWRPIAIEGRGAGTGQGPPLPQIVLGQSQEALRAYRAELNRLVELGPSRGGISPAVADKRWAEAKETATLAISEAQTYQRDEESRRNADVNLRTNAMSNATSGFNSALDFVSKLNATLPEGSTAGGTAFAALLDLQQMQAIRMGAGRNEFSGGRPRSPEARSIDAAAGSTIGTAQSAIGTLLQQPPGAPAAPAMTEAEQQQAAAAASTPPAIDPASIGAPEPPVSEAPVPDMPALANYQRMSPTPAPVAAPSAMPGSEMPLAVRANQIASTPPWNLSEDDYNWAVANGLEDQFWSKPGRVA